ncbi:MAG: hypothetical protein F2934_04715 [Actinobacteria bacterium]|jgi:hypothetical protein|uniref:Unannotated protein n=1 Tax=freshwater metagenome TaxID=449393 RepID=A0A6J7U4P2_9ZZZZ|nr:hypothetical protein [Actinomycetota bacterium]MSY12057.1 hypothetical protein [Actinomycetota bacterium]MSZ03605.1 hypothetical protein [Actinomycetota bacterium]MTB06417.1 hypothetical protein [Actinomycetota bacterium]
MATHRDRAVVTPPAELLARMSVTMKTAIAPNTTGTAKPQAYMAAVVLEKLAKQLELAPAHAAQQASDAESLIADLTRLTASLSLPDGTTAAVSGVSAACNAVSICTLVQALYADRTLLGDDLFAALLSRVRVALRADINRRMEFSA